MPFLIYSLVGLSAFKLVIDAIGGNQLATYSVFLESILLGFLLAILIRTSVKQKLAERETLAERLKYLRKEVEGPQ